MRVVVKLSEETRNLMVGLGHIDQKDLNEENNHPISLSKVYAFLNDVSEPNESSHFSLEAFRASLLRDLRHTLAPKAPDEETDSWSKYKYWLLFFSGSILALYAGYDNVSSFLPFITSPVWLPVLVILFMLGSILSFYAFEMGQISDNLGVKSSETRQLLDVLVDQAQEINILRKFLKEEMANDNSTTKKWMPLLDMLQIRQNYLHEVQGKYQTQLNEGFYPIVKKIITVATGLVFFTSGYILSQAPVQAFLLLLGMAASSIVLPAALISIISGLAAFALYWYVQRPGVDDFIASCFGLSQAKIAGLDQVKKQTLTGKEVSVTSQLAELKQQMTSKPEKVHKGTRNRLLVECSTQTESNKHHRFFKPIPMMTIATQTDDFRSEEALENSSFAL